MTRSSQLTPQRSRRWPKMANSYSIELLDLTVHGVYFEPTVEILPNRIKVRKFFPVKTRLPFPTPINMDGFHGLNMKKIGSKNHKKSASFPVSAAFFSLHRGQWPPPPSPLVCPPPSPL